MLSKLPSCQASADTHRLGRVLSQRSGAGAALLGLPSEPRQRHCSCMANKQLSLVLYRTIWRWARAADGVPYHLRFEDVCTVAPACLQPVGEAICAPSVPLQESAAVRALARRAFRDSAHLQVGRRVTKLPSSQVGGCRVLTPVGGPVCRVRQLRMLWTAGWRCARLLCLAMLQPAPRHWVHSGPLLLCRLSGCCITTTPGM